MNRSITNFIQLLTISLFTLSTFAQELGKQKNEMSKNENGLSSLIIIQEKSNYKISDSKQIFQEQLGLKQNQNYSILKTETDNEGFTHQKYQLFDQGIKVEFATYTLHSKNGKIASMSGEFYNSNNTITKPSISEQTAFNKAIKYTGAKHYLWENLEESKFMNYQKPVGELVLLPNIVSQDINNSNTELRLAYKFDIYATNPISRGDLYIDANNGNVLYYNATIKHLGEFSHEHISEKIQNDTFCGSKSVFVAGNASTKYSGTQLIQTLLNGTSYTLSDNTRGNGIETKNCNKGSNYWNATNFSDVDNNWTAAEFANTNMDNAALDAHWGAEKTYDYFKNIHYRNSYDNAGAKIKNYVHYANFGVPVDNAFWNGEMMSYGDGSGTRYKPLVSLDITAHEIGHAICQKTANLAYQKESGAMNEGFSDIWAACVEYFAAPSKSTWLIGEDVMVTGYSPYRSMTNPKFYYQPDTYRGINWKDVNCGTPTPENDFCGVHINSGVLNHWFYILSMGKIGTNDKGNAYNVTGISIDKSAKIAYRLETVYLSANSTFADARTSGIQAAIDLYGVGSAEVIATTNAWYAVGVGASYVPGGSGYCVSTSVTTAYQKIGKVVLGTINNTSNGTVGYENFIFQSTNLKKGTANTITITPSWASTIYNEGYAVWIDYNKDGDFVDSGELVWSKPASQLTPVSGSFTIPATAVLGTTRMRVSLKNNGIPTPCESFTYGQVEDYSVNITAATVAKNALSKKDDFEISNEPFELKLYPNPVEYMLTISNSDDTNATFRIINLLGQVVKTGTMNEKVINVSNLNGGMYIFEATENDKTISKKFIKK
jgi:bacillolysin